MSDTTQILSVIVYGFIFYNHCIETENWTLVK